MEMELEDEGKLMWLKLGKKIIQLGMVNMLQDK